MSASKGKAAKRKRLRRRVAGEQNWRCAYCGTRMDDNSATLDHVTPLALGGHDCWDNAVAACRWCNQFKGARGGSWFWTQIEAIRARLAKHCGPEAFQ